jgi:hypothetical protein
MPSGYVMPFHMPTHVVAPRPTLALRARVWRKSLDLDAELAGGADPDRTDELRLRAAQLADPKRRARLAAAIDHLLLISSRPERPGIITAQAPFRPRQVRANRELLEALAKRLRDPNSLSLRGLALVSLLLEDGRGPLSRDERPVALRRAASAALAALGTDHEASGRAAQAIPA